MAKNAEQNQTPNPTQGSPPASRGSPRGTGRGRGGRGSPGTAGFQTGGSRGGHGSTRGSPRGGGSPKGGSSPNGGSQGRGRGGRGRGRNSPRGTGSPNRPPIDNVDPNDSDSALVREFRKEFRQQLPKHFWKQTDRQKLSTLDKLALLPAEFKDYSDQEKHDWLKAHGLGSIRFPKNRDSHSKGNATADLNGKGADELDEFGLPPPPDSPVKDQTLGMGSTGILRCRQHTTLITVYTTP